MKILLLWIAMHCTSGLAQSLYPEFLSNDHTLLPKEDKLGYVSEVNQTKSQNAFETFKPASTAKILTALTAIQNLGEHYQFKTEVKWKTSHDDKTWISDLVLVGEGDPTFSGDDFGETTHHQRFETLIEFLKKEGVKTITFSPKFISSLQNSDFRKNFQFPEGWTQNDIDGCYGFSALPSAFHYREDCSLYSITDIDKGFWDLPLLQKKIISKLKYGNTNKFEIHFDPLLKNHVLSGTFVKGSKPNSLPIPLLYEDTIQLLEAEFKNALISAGFQLTNLKPNNLNEMEFSFTLKSPELLSFLKPFLKNSLNFVGESLVTALGEGDYEKGAQKLKNQLELFKTQNSLTEQIIDGCGLSRSNSITPQTMMNLLKTIQNDSHLFSTFLDLMPISGIDGTLKNRLDGSLTNKIHAKTGSLDGISNLAGFALDNKKTWKPFVIFNQSSTISNPKEDVDAFLIKEMKE